MNIFYPAPSQMVSCYWTSVAPCQTVSLLNRHVQLEPRNIFYFFIFSSIILSEFMMKSGVIIIPDFIRAWNE